MKESIVFQNQPFLSSFLNCGIIHFNFFRFQVGWTLVGTALISQNRTHVLDIQCICGGWSVGSSLVVGQSEKSRQLTILQWCLSISCSSSSIMSNNVVMLGNMNVMICGGTGLVSFVWTRLIVLRARTHMFWAS